MTVKGPWNVYSWRHHCSFRGMSDWRTHSEDGAIAICRLIDAGMGLHNTDVLYVLKKDDPLNALIRLVTRIGSRR